MVAIVTLEGLVRPRAPALPGRERRDARALVDVPAWLVEVGREFGLAAPRAIQVVKPREVWRAQCGSASFAFHLHRPEVTRDHLGLKHLVLNTLGQADVPVPDVVRRTTGEAVFELDGQVGDITRWIEHPSFGRDSRENMLLGASVLARLHDRPSRGFVKRSAK